MRNCIFSFSKENEGCILPDLWYIFFLVDLLYYCCFYDDIGRKN